MPINPTLLISAAMLQDYIVDKLNGLPLSAGIITLYIDDNNRQTLKNWYYQTGTPGNYSYIPLTNPLVLSLQGTITDPQGNDIIPFYYPFDENDQNKQQFYYVTVYSAATNGNPSTLQFVRQNFPALSGGTGGGGGGGGGGGSGINTSRTMRNYIINNVFWHNVGATNVSTQTNLVIAGSQHAGYVGNGDIRFIKNGTDSTDNISFPAIPQTFTADITPEYWINLNCTAAGTETLKYIQYPLSLHVKTLQNIQVTLSFWALNSSGNTNNTVAIYVYQYTGTGAVSPSNLVSVQNFTIATSPTQYNTTFVLPDASTLNLGNGGDDALFIQFRYPTGVTCNISHTKLQVYLGNQFATNDFNTYEQISTITGSPRTGDFKMSVNNFIGYDWIACTGGTIGNLSSNASYKNPYSWPLYSFLWNTFVTKVSNAALYLPIFDSTGGVSTYGATAIADFNANKQLALTKTIGHVMMGGSTLQTPSNVTVSGNNLNASLGYNFNSYFTGIPILVSSTGTLPGGISANTIYFAIYVDASNIKVATTYANALSGTNITITSSGSGTITVLTTIAGTYLGENFHTQTINEMPSHNHAGAATLNKFLLERFAQGITDDFRCLSYNPLSTYPIDITVASEGGGAPFNIVQQSVFYNVFLKL
jgi:hypothetical protein